MLFSYIVHVYQEVFLMKFKVFLEGVDLADKPITDVWPINKHFYDFSTDQGKRDYESDLADWRSFMQQRRSRKVVFEKQISEPFEITCWRGCSARTLERNTIDIKSGYRILHGDKSIENILWFTHSLQSKDYGKNYALSYAEDFLITYPLKATKHFVIKKYDDGKIEYLAPPNMKDKIDSVSASRFFMTENSIYEVPEGWFFTWQIQKHLGCSHAIKVSDSMIKSTQS
jgi:hypothetical protein